VNLPLQPLFCRQGFTAMGLFNYEQEGESLEDSFAHLDTTRWFKYDRDYLCVNKSQFVPVIFEPPCILTVFSCMSV
jgi:hypothetical protein